MKKLMNVMVLVAVFTVMALATGCGKNADNTNKASVTIKGSAQ